MDLVLAALRDDGGTLRAWTVVGRTGITAGRGGDYSAYSAVMNALEYLRREGLVEKVDADEMGRWTTDFEGRPLYLPADNSLAVGWRATVTNDEVDDLETIWEMPVGKQPAIADDIRRIADQVKDSGRGCFIHPTLADTDPHDE